MSKMRTKWQSVIFSTLKRTDALAVRGRSTLNDGNQFLERAFEPLISEQYSSFILTICCITVAFVYSPDDSYFKVFDSHARDIYGKGQIEGTHVLLDITSKDNVVQYFQNSHGITKMYEHKGLSMGIYRNSFAGNICFSNYL